MATTDPGTVWTKVLNDETSQQGVVIRDFSSAVPASGRSENVEPGKWSLKPYRLANGQTGRALWVDERVKLGGSPIPLPGEVQIDPALTGWHAIFVSVHRPKWFGGIDVRLSGRPWTFINPMEREVYRRDPNQREETPAGPNDIEIEFFYTFARMDGQRIHLRYPYGKKCIEFPAERGRAGITALRFVPLTDEQVKDFQADIVNPDTRRIIVNFETYNGMCDLLESRIAAWAESDVWALHMEIASSSGGMMYPGSRYEQAWGENIPEQSFPALKSWARDCLISFRNLLAEGKTPFTLAIPAARKAAIRVMGSLRMDLFWGDGPDNPADWKAGTCDDYPFLFNGRFYRGHPNLRIPGSNNLDYYYPEVREHFSNLLCEAAERFDLDGINMDFTRWPPFIRPEADFAVMVDFIQNVRRRLDEIGKRKKRRLSLSAELVDGHYVGLTLTQQRVDLAAWMKTGCLDYVGIERTNEPFRPVPGDHEMDYYIDLGRRLGVPVYPRQDTLIEGMAPPCAMTSISTLDSDPLIGDEFLDDPKIQPYCGPDHYEKRILQFYKMGAGRVVLSNRWDAWLTLRRLGHRAELEKRTQTGTIFGIREGLPITL
jgi:hypothetical protein